MQVRAVRHRYVEAVEMRLSSRWEVETMQFDAPLWVKGGAILIGLAIAFVTVWIAHHREKKLHEEVPSGYEMPGETHLSRAA